MGLSAHELHDALHAGLERTRWRPSAPLYFPRHAIWLTTSTVRIDGPRGQLRWTATVHDWRGHGFTRRQAKQMIHALEEGFRHDADRLDSLILAIVDRHPTQ